MTAVPIQRLISRDIYWGEFREEELDTALSLAEKDFNASKAYMTEKLGRGEFVFGLGRSDFIYYLNLDKASVCLDCGCGLGAHTFNMARVSKEVHAFDQSLKRLQFIEHRARHENVGNIRLYHSDFEHLPFRENMFDAIVLNGVVEWLGVIRARENPRDDQVAVLRQLHGYLKPGGRLYIGIENRFALAYLRGRDHNGIRFTNYFPRILADLVTRLKTGRPYRTYTYGARGYRHLLRDSGFMKPTEFYVAHPGYNEPQYLIAFNDFSALEFFYRAFSRSRGVFGIFVSFASKYKIFLKALRQLIWSYAIFVDK